LTKQSGSIYEFGPFRLNPGEEQLHRDGQLVQITPKAFEALVFFVERPGRLIGKEELLQALWPDSFVEEANLTHHVWRLRKILDENKDGTRYIETVPKRGYRFAGAVTTQAAAERSSEATSALRVSPSLANGENGSLTPNPRVSPLAERMTLGKTEVVARLPTIKTRYLITAGIIGVVLVTGLVLLWRVRERNRLRSLDQNRTLRSLAVLPFKPLNAESSNATLELGIADALITRLSNLKDISVRPTSAVLKYSAANLDLPATGRALEVESVLDGRVAADWRSDSCDDSANPQ
jgi:DNA-binding winged helix-turn-helix (wHTH) protein